MQRVLGPEQLMYPSRVDKLDQPPLPPLSAAAVAPGGVPTAASSPPSTAPCFRALAAPAGGLLQRLACAALSFHRRLPSRDTTALLGTLLHLWQCLVGEARAAWERCECLPHLDASLPGVDTALVQQKLQMLNFCGAPIPAQAAFAATAHRRDRYSMTLKRPTAHTAFALLVP